jgi:ornithine--oxo-acid transaminase
MAALEALAILREEDLSRRSRELGDLLVKTILDEKPPHLKEISGDGLFRAVVLDIPPANEEGGMTKIQGRRLCALLASRGVLASATGSGARVRLCPPLTIEREKLVEGAKIVAQGLRDLESYDADLGWLLM